jgi:uncharacterized protein YecE (DUF72 family)
VSPGGPAGSAEAMAGRILVGTSSWADPGFVAEWYPPGLPASERLGFYAERFDVVEVNATWYGLPAPAATQRWVEQTPHGFTFDVKLHRLLTRHAAHPEDLPSDLREGVDLTPRGRIVLDERLERTVVARTLEGLEPLVQAGRLGALLLQLSPSFKPGAHRLEELDGLLELLAPHRVAVELRHRGWLDEERREATLGWYERHGAVWVGVDAPEGSAPTLLPALDAVTRPELAYLRAHGRNAKGWMTGRDVAERFAHHYDDGELRELTGRAERLAEQADQVHLQFNNNRGRDAPEAARRTKELLGQDPGPPVPARDEAAHAGA